MVRGLRLFSAAVAVAAALVVAAPAQADVSPSTGYCLDSLRGLTGQAPDNDIGARIDYLQRLYGINIYDWYIAYWQYENDHHLHAGIRWKWRTATNGGTFLEVAHCYLNWPHTASRSYHDGFSH